MIALIISLCSGAIVYAVSVMYAGIGETFSERAGIMNLGVEGVMLMGAVSGYITAVHTQNLFLSFLVVLSKRCYVCAAVFSPLEPAFADRSRQHLVFYHCIACDMLVLLAERRFSPGAVSDPGDGISRGHDADRKGDPLEPH